MASFAIGSSFNVFISALTSGIIIPLLTFRFNNIAPVKFITEALSFGLVLVTSVLTIDTLRSVVDVVRDAITLLPGVIVVDDDDDEIH